MRDVHVHQPQGGGDRFPGRDFLGRRDRVLQVENHGVRSEIEDLGDLARMIARREKKTAKRTHLNFPIDPSL